MEERYARNVPALTNAECTCLRQKCVLVAGCGGLGGHIIDQLARIGIGAIRAVDGDTFDTSNLNRQLLSEMALLGTGKAKAAEDRVRRVNPDVQIQAVQDYITADNVRSLIAGCDAVLDGLDNIAGRKLLAEACAEAGIPYIYGAICGWVAQAAVSMPGDALMEKLYPEDTVLTDRSVLSFTPALCASMQVSLCVRLLAGRPVESGRVYYYDLLNQEFETIPLG